MTEIEDEVRAMLRDRAAEVQPTPGGLDAIQAKLAGERAIAAPAQRRNPAPWLVAAAVLTVTGIVGGTLLAKDDPSRDRTVVAGEGESPEGTPGATSARLDAVWPSDDPEVLRGISAAWARDDSPLPAVRLYLEDRLGSVPSDEHLVVDGTTVTVTEETAVEVHLARLDGDGPWYVQRAESGVLDVALDFDGERVTGEVIPGSAGSLAIGFDSESSGSGSESSVQAEEVVPVDASFDPVAALVAKVTLAADVGIIALHEEKLVGTTEEAPAPPDEVATGATLGVWPKPLDEVTTAGLEPQDVAALYVEDTVGATAQTVLSEFREGDTTSGEVEVSGDYEATIVLRRVDGQWYVEAVHTELVGVFEGAPGELRLVANEEGILSAEVLDSWGTVVQSMPGRGVAAGEEALVVPAEPVRKPFTVRYRLQTPGDADPSAGYARTGLGDVAVAAPAGSEPAVHEVPEEAIYAAGGSDPVGTAQGYIEARLGFVPEDMRLIEPDPDPGDRSDATHAVVDWSRGSVFLVLHDDLWYVTESVGASVSFEDVQAHEFGYDVDVFLGEPGVLQVELRDAEGGVCDKASAEVDGRGAVRVSVGWSDLEAPCDGESIVATMNEVVAERAV